MPNPSPSPKAITISHYHKTKIAGDTIVSNSALKSFSWPQSTQHMHKSQDPQWRECRNVSDSPEQTFCSFRNMPCCSYTKIPFYPQVQLESYLNYPCKIFYDYSKAIRYPMSYLHTSAKNYILNVRD